MEQISSTRARQPGMASSMVLASTCVAALLVMPGAAIAAPGLDVGELMGVPTEEGNAATLTVTLTEPPTSDVFVEVTASIPDAVIVSPSTLTFTPGSWLVPQTVSVQGVDDEKEDGDELVALAVTVAAGSDPAYAGLPAVHRNARVLDDETTLVIESGPMLCIGPTTEDLYQGSTVLTRYDREHPAALGLVFDPSDLEQDDVEYVEHSDERYLSLRTLHVVLRNTLDSSMTDSDVAVLSRRYATAAHQIYVASGANVMLDYDQVVIDEWYGDWAFGTPGTPEEGGFTAYHALRFDLLLAGHDVDDYDIVNVSVGVAQKEIAPNLPKYAAAYAKTSDGGPWFTNGSTWGNDRTWTTVQFADVPKSLVWRDNFMHEMNHTMEWMLEYWAYPEHRGADDPWWLATYPNYLPGSTGFDDIDVLTMFWARPKRHYEELAGVFGELRTRPAMHLVEKSCADEQTLQMRRVYCEYGVSCNSFEWDGETYELGCRCNTEAPQAEGGGR